MSTKLIWQLIVLAFALLIVGIFVAEDLQKVVGVVIVCAAATVAISARLMRQSQR